MDGGGIAADVTRNLRSIVIRDDVFMDFLRATVVGKGMKSARER